MEQIINITYDQDHQQPVVSSLQVAKDFNKDHGKVIRAIEKHIADLKATEPKVAWFYETSYTDKKGEVRKQFLMNRDGFSLLIMSFNNTRDVLDWKIKYIKAFNEMEAKLKNGIPSTPEEKIDLLLEVAHNQKGKVKEIDERVTKIEKDQKIDPTQYGYIGKLVNRRVQEVKEVYKYTWNSTQVGVLRHGINSDICNALDAHPRTQIRAHRFDEACRFIMGWNPSSVTLKEIEELEEHV